jgi:hypothetical protein
VFGSTFLATAAPFVIGEKPFAVVVDARSAGDIVETSLVTAQNKKTFF